jgi:hypothetical protein
MMATQMVDPLQKQRRELDDDDDDLQRIEHYFSSPSRSLQDV